MKPSGPLNQTPHFQHAIFAACALLLLHGGRSVAEEGAGPFPRLEIRNAMVVDGTGAPPYGPVNIVVEQDRIVAVDRAVPDSQETTGGRHAVEVLDAEGMYVTPGFVDLHGHIRPGPPEEYIYKLWLAHGVTTIRDAACHRGIEFCVAQKRLSNDNRIVAPRIFAYVHSNLDFAGPRFGYDWDGGRVILTADDAREYVRWVSQRGVDGLKSYGQRPDVLAALIDEATKHQLGVAIHINQLYLARLNAVAAARLGVVTLEHWYGTPESLLEESSLVDYTPGYNYLDEVDRFSEWGASWAYGAEPGSEKWQEVLQALLETGVAMDPTLAIGESLRDVIRAENKPWFDDYGHPAVMDRFKPDPDAHGGFLHEWTTGHEAVFFRAYDKWQRFLEDYKNAGGRVTLGTDSGVFYSLYGFAYIREMELLQHAGFNPLEVIRSATHFGAEVIARPTGKPAEFGLVAPGYLADLVVIDGNPLENFKILYGTGILRRDRSTGEARRLSSIRHTIKDGIVYDARKLLADVRAMVEAAR